jgi:hypothetical protein
MTEQNKTDHDILVELKIDMKWVKQFLTDHHAHHRRLLYVGIGVIASVLGGIILNALLP